MRLGTKPGSGSHHPRRRRALWKERERGDIIYAVGVRGAVSSSARNAGPCEFVAEIVEVLRSDTHFQHFFNHRQEISQRANRVQGRSIGWPNQAARRRQHQRVFDHVHRKTALIKLGCQRPVGTANRPMVPGVFRYASSTWRTYSSWLSPVSIWCLSLAVRAMKGRRWARCGTGAVDGLTRRPPWDGCLGRWATHRSPSWW